MCTSDKPVQCLYIFHFMFLLHEGGRRIASTNTGTWPLRESLLSAIFVVEKGVCLEPYEVNSEARESLKSTKELMWGKSSAYCWDQRPGSSSESSNWSLSRIVLFYKQIQQALIDRYTCLFNYLRIWISLIVESPLKLKNIKTAEWNSNDPMAQGGYMV